MKVAFLLQDTRALYGAERATLQLVSGLAQAGLELQVLLLRESRLGPGLSPLAEALRARAPVAEIPVADRFSRRACAQIREIMISGKFDLLHSTGYKADWHAAWASGDAGLFPVISTVHGWLFRWQLKERLYQELDLRVLRRFPRVVVLSRFYEKYLIRRGFSPLQLARIPTGLEAEGVVSRAEAGELWNHPPQPFVFGMLGRLSHEKNHRLLLRAAARLARALEQSPQPWRIWIAGEGPLRPRLQRQISHLGLADRVTLAGWQEPADFFRQIHVLVQCSRIENQPLSVMEALAWERPVIAAEAGGLPELVRAGENGWLVPPNDSRALAATLREALVHPEESRARGCRGRQLLAQEFSPERMIREHLGLYETERRG